MSLYNRIANSANRFQGDYKRVLCVCSAGLLRSPTTAFVLSQEPYNYNTRAAGIEEDFALVVVDDVLLDWAQEVVCMNKGQKHRLETRLKKLGKTTKVIALELPDQYEYRNPELIKLIKEKYDEASAQKEESNETQ